MLLDRHLTHPGVRGMHPGCDAYGHHAGRRSPDHYPQPCGERGNWLAPALHPVRAQHVPVLVCHVKPPGPHVQSLGRERRALSRREVARCRDLPRPADVHGGLDHVARGEGACPFFCAMGKKIQGKAGVWRRAARPSVMFDFFFNCEVFKVGI